MSVISNNLVFGSIFVILKESQHAEIKQFRFLRNDKMTADFSVMIKNGHSNKNFFGKKVYYDKSFSIF